MNYDEDKDVDKVAEQDNPEQNSAASDAGAMSTEQLLQHLAEAQEEARTNLGGWQRTQADFENFKKRKENEAQELVIFAREVVVAKILPTLDSLEQGLKHIPAKDDAEFSTKFDVWKKGIDATLLQLDKALAEMGVTKIIAVGKPFDPNFHEAIREVPVTEIDGEDGMVMEEFQTGYELNGKVIRPSQVSISKKG